MDSSSDQEEEEKAGASAEADASDEDKTSSPKEDEESEEEESEEEQEVRFCCFIVGQQTQISLSFIQTEHPESCFSPPNPSPAEGGGRTPLR